ncbi:MAG: TetR/AcrR family transcriptional regulator [Bacteroidota bacterium]
MSPRTQNQFQALRKSRKDRIIETALELFASEGYHSVSISQIAVKAEMSKGLLYNYFPSKEELLNAILVLGLEKIHDILARIEDELDTPEELLMYIRGGFQTMKKEPEFYKLYFGLLFQPGISDHIKEKYQDFANHLNQDVACYFKSKGDPNPEEKAFLLEATIDAVGRHYLMSSESVDLDKMEKIIFELFK